MRSRYMITPVLCALCALLLNVVSIHAQDLEKRNEAIAHEKAVETLLNNLNAKRHVSSGEVQEVIKSSWLSENKKGSKKWPKSLKLIENTIPYASDNPLHHAWLYEQAANLLRKEGRTEEAEQKYLKAQEILEALDIDTAIRRVNNLLNRADLAVERKEKDKADALFLKAKSYPYYLSNAKDDKMRSLREAHERAIRGLIITRSGRVDALKEIRLIPAMKGFQPFIDEAIKAAQ